MTVQRIKTGDISARIGLTITAKLIEDLGFPPDDTEKRAQLWDADKYPAICKAISKHVASKADSTAMAERKSSGKAPSKSAPPPVDDDDEL